MLTKDDYIQVINQSITQSAEPWKNDPFELLLKQFPKEYIEKFGDSAAIEAIPSTSDDVRTVNADARIQFSQVLGNIYLNLAEALEKSRSELAELAEQDEHQLVSLQNCADVKRSFEFFLLAGILPFLEPGVGLGAATRSTFIKSWKVYDGNKEACIEKLDFASRVIIALLKCNTALAASFLPKFIDDVLSVRFQMVELGVDRHEPAWEEILSKCPVDLLFGSLMFLTQDKRTSTPKWLKAACGRHMTKILVGKDGLAHLLQYYLERAGDNWTDNMPLARQVGWHLATVPRMFRHPIKYHEIISNQFFETFWKQQPAPEKNITNVFACYTEEMRVRFSLNADLTIFDKILGFWEILNRKIADKTNVHAERITDFSPNHVRNLRILSQIQQSADVKRIRAIFTCLFATIELFPTCVKDILRAAMENVGNLGYALYQHVMVPTHGVRVVKASTSSAMIQEIGENADDDDADDHVAEEMWLDGIEETDEGIARRLDTAFYIIDNVLTATQCRTILEMMSLGLEDFLKTSEKEREDDLARFVQLDGGHRFSSFHAHIVVGCCFERLMMINENAGFSIDDCSTLFRTCETILNNATAKFYRLASRKRQLDVFQMSADEQKEFECTRDTAKMCIPMVTMLFQLTQPMSRLYSEHQKAIESLCNFTKAVDAFPSDDETFNATIDEVKRFLIDIRLDFDAVPQPIVPVRLESRRRYSQGDVCNELIEELHDDEPAVKGGALMQVSKVFRMRNYLCGRLLEYGVFDLAKELVIDEDSYVYLAAINALCEMALHERAQFEGLLEYYQTLTEFREKDEQMVSRVGRVAEALGKVFLQKGDIMATYVDRLAPIFIAGLDERDEILRASACGAFGNLLVAAGGRGIEKWLQQVLQRLFNMIRIDGSRLVRRAAVDFVRQLLAATGSDMFESQDVRLELHNILREVQRLERTDRDETVRLQAQLCSEEISRAINENHERTMRGYARNVRF